MTKNNYSKRMRIADIITHKTDIICNLYTAPLISICNAES